MPRHRKYEFTKNTVLEWANQFPSLQTYLNTLISHKGEMAQRVWHFCDYTKKTPEELLMLKEDYNSLVAERLLNNFVSNAKLPVATKKNVVNCVRGFFRVNMLDLRREAGKLEYVQLKPQRTPPKAQRLALYKVCYTPRDKAAVLVATCTALALNSMANLKWSHFEEDWTTQEVPCIILDSPLLKGKGVGKYKGTKQITFLTPEAKQHLIEYRDWFSKTFNYTWQPTDNVFLNIRHPVSAPINRAGMSQLFIELVKRCNVPFGIHDGRRIVQTALESTGCPMNWIKKVKGRKCSGEEAPYSKPAIEQLRAKYKEAIPELQFLTPTVAPEEVKDLAADVADLKRFMRELDEKISQRSL